MSRHDSLTDQLYELVREINLAGDKNPRTASVRRTRSMLKRMKDVAKTGVRRSQLRRQRKRPITLPKLSLVQKIDN